MPLSWRKQKKRLQSAKKVTLKKLNKKVNKIQRLASSEVKYIDNYDNFLLDTANPLTNIRTVLPIPRGTGVQQRIGSKVIANKIEFIYDILNTGPNSFTGFIRVCLVYDKFPNQVQANLAALFDPNPLTGLNFGHLNFKSVESKERFVFVYDKIFVQGHLSNAGDVVGGNKPPIFTTKFTKKLAKKTEYIEVSPNGVIGEITQGAWYLLAWASVEPVGSRIQIDTMLRLHYTDS